MLRITETTGGIRLEIRVQPRSSRNQIVGEQNGVLKVKLTAPPVDGEANAALVGFIAHFLKIPRKNVNLIKGETSRNKLVEITGFTSDEFLTRLELNK